MAKYCASTALGAALFIGTPGVAFAADAKVASKSEITFELDVKHESNVARGSAARAAQRGLTRSDERATPSLSLSLLRSVGRHSFGLEAQLGYDFYRRNTRLNRERISVAPSANIAISACNLSLSPQVSRKQSDLADLNAFPSGGTGADTVRNSETINEFSTRLACGAAYGFRPYGEFDRTIADNSDARRALSNFRTSRFGGGLLYATPVVGQITLGYDRAKTDYPNRILTAGGNDGFTVDSVNAKLERSIGSRLTGTIGISYVSLKPRRGGVDSFNNVTWDIGLTANVGANLQVHAAVSRSVQPSLVTDSLYHVDKEYSLDATYAFNKRISLKVGGSSHPRTYFGAGSAFGPALTNDRRDEVFATLAYLRSKRVRFFLDAGYQTRRANDAFYNFDNGYIGLRTQFSL